MNDEAYRKLSYGSIGPERMSESLDLRIQGMSCTACAARIEKAVGRLPGVHRVSVSYAARTAWISYAPDTATAERIVDRIRELGFEAAPPDQDDPERETAALRLRFAVSAALTLPLMWAMAHHYSFLQDMPVPALFMNGWFQLGAAAIVQFVVGLPFYFGAYNAIREKVFNMDVLVAVGTSAAFLHSHYTLFRGAASGGAEQPLYFETSAVVITAVLLGKLLESSAAVRALREAGGSGGTAASQATVIRAGQELRLPADQVRPGDDVLVREGEPLPVDGIVTQGEASVVEAMLTGESLPVDKAPGDPVWAGTTLASGQLRIRARAAGGATMVSRIYALVRQAQSSKTTIQRKVDQLAGWFVPLMMMLATATFAAWYVWLAPGDGERAMMSALAVLLAACPCALGLATPISLVIASGKLARQGVVVKEAGALERLALLDAIVVDKTGTVTEGKPRLTGMLAVQGSRSALLRNAAAAEADSAHPLARAIREAAAAAGLVPPKPAGASFLPGRGVEAAVDGRRFAVGNAAMADEQGWAKDERIAAFAAERERSGETVLYAAENGIAVGALAFADPVRPSSRGAVRRLRRSGLAVVLATGDREAPALAAAREAGIADVRHSMLPAQKLRLIEQLRAEGRRVGMAGDGWNDAPALAAADVGFAMGDGTDAAMGAGHIALLRSQLTGIGDALAISRLTMRNIRQNLAFAFAYNAVIIPFAACGMLKPWMAGTAMALSSVSVVGNALRLGPRLARLAGKERP
ncbi:heavy metal translocating P-type ATPase [Paenibacillus cisolokensis]|uniref:heavy metal translocating P-type ATPase n=1 Tax=Paenibacillus cisolokensis TaxID=1658519 RepID=UPI003D27E658